LSFDFVGTCLDDSAEDVSTIQVRQHTARQGWHIIKTRCEWQLIILSE
jgi:hypothetical protein